MNSIILENWSIEYHKDPVSKESYYRLNGNVYNHPKPWILNGEYIFTSKLQNISFRTMQAETNNNIYNLKKQSDGTIIPFAGPRAS